LARNEIVNPRIFNSPWFNFLLQRTELSITFAIPKKGKIAYRGMVERFIAPVLKTGDLSRGPGVRIPLPLLLPFQVKLKASNFHTNSRLFVFIAFQTETGDYVLTEAYDLLCTRIHTPRAADMALPFQE
jgi:hypothetical protein